MPEQIQKNAPQSASEAEHAAAAKSLVNDELNQDVEDLLAEIDGVLEENAEEFVKSYIQRGGE